MKTIAKYTVAPMFVLFAASAIATFATAGCSHANDTAPTAAELAAENAKAAAAPLAAAPAAAPTAGAAKAAEEPHADCKGKKHSDDDDDVAGSLHGPRVEVALNRAPTLGPRDAKVTIVAFSDFQCPFCAKTTPILEELQAKYPGKVRIAYKQNPLPFHEHATLAAKATLAASEQGKFWELHDILAKNPNALERKDIDGYAQSLGLDMRRFASDVDGTRLDAQIADDLAQAKALGVRGTPTVFVNGRRIVGAQGRDVFTKVVEEELTASAR